MQELERNPIILDGHPMKYSESGKYLGDKLSPNLSQLVSETVKMRLGVQQSRLQFKINSKITPKIASNFHRDARYREMNYLSVGCSVGSVSEPASENLNQSLDSEDHLVRCVAYSDLRQNLDLNVQSDLLTYFQLVIDRRIAEEQKS